MAGYEGHFDEVKALLHQGAPAFGTLCGSNSLCKASVLCDPPAEGKVGSSSVLLGRQLLHFAAWSGMLSPFWLTPPCTHRRT